VVGVEIDGYEFNPDPFPLQPTRDVSLTYPF